MSRAVLTAQVWRAHGGCLERLARSVLDEQGTAHLSVMEAIAAHVARLEHLPLSGRDADRRMLIDLVARRCIDLNTEALAAPELARLPAAMRWLTEVTLLQRTAVALSTIGEHSYCEVAELLDVLPTTVLALLRAARPEQRRSPSDVARVN